MNFKSLLFGVAMIFSLPAWQAAAQDNAPTHAKIETSMGDIVIELYTDDAPLTVANFFAYAEKGRYDRSIFHRVVPGYVIQGGGYSRYFNARPTNDPVKYEGDNGRKNLRGTIAMARTEDPNSAQGQWFINLKDNPDFDHRIFEDLPIYGYAVFGAVVEGMDVVDAIGAVATGPGGPFEDEVPLETILINKVDPAQWPKASD